MCDIMLFGGTTEGRELIRRFRGSGAQMHVFVATEYGESLIAGEGHIKVTAKRMDENEMAAEMNRSSCKVVVDATHPYASEVTQNIKNACRAADKKYLRITREQASTITGDIIYLDDIGQAVEYLKNHKGRVFLTTGSNELAQFTQLPGYQERVTARVLSTAESVIKCEELGFYGKNLVCMQGPFSEGMNYEMFIQSKAEYLVTKESGVAGGFQEKIAAAKRAGLTILVIGRPAQEPYYDIGQGTAQIKKILGLASQVEVTLVGIGMDTVDTITQQGLQAIKQAELLIGSKRTLGLFSGEQSKFCSYDPEQIAEYIGCHPEFEKVAVLLSGDTGFYSGAKKLKAVLQKYNPRILPGVSSVSYFFSKLGRPWQDVPFISMHGQEGQIVPVLQKSGKVFALLGSGSQVKQICLELAMYGLEAVMLYAGEALGSSSERITAGTPGQLLQQEFGSLTVVYAEWRDYQPPVVTPGIGNGEFCRGKVPMTKAEIRAISLAKLKLKEASVVYDIGAGTGSVAVECALQSQAGNVYAVEKKAAAVELIEANSQKFKTANLQVIKGSAPEALEQIKAVPTHSFIGGSSGNMEAILDHLLELNPEVRIVINCITLETVAEVTNWIKGRPHISAEIVQANVSVSKQVGGYHMMMAENPVYIFTLQGGTR